MPYIGQSLTEGTRREYNYVATAGQTVFPAVYTVGAVDVYQNGVLLAPTDYTATTGTTVVFGTGAAYLDEITIYCHNTFSVADTYTKSASDDRFVNASGDTMTGGLTVVSPDNSGSTNIVKAVSNNLGQSVSMTFTGLKSNAAAGIDFVVNETTSAMSIDSSGDVTLNNDLHIPYNSLNVGGSDQGMLHIGATHHSITGSSTTSSNSYTDYPQSSVNYQKKKANSYLRIRCWLDVGGAFGNTSGAAYMGVTARLSITDVSNAANNVVSGSSTGWVRIDTHTGTYEWSRMVFMEWTPDQDSVGSPWIMNGTPNINIKVQYYRDGTGNLGVGGCGIWGGRSIITVDEFDRRT